jgi:hypothetical protein
VLFEHAAATISAAAAMANRPDALPIMLDPPFE